MLLRRFGCLRQIRIPLDRYSRTGCSAGCRGVRRGPCRHARAYAGISSLLLLEQAVIGGKCS